MNHVVIIDNTFDVVYSDYDGIWYVQRFPDQACSNEEFATENDARAALNRDDLTWDK